MASAAQTLRSVPPPQADDTQDDDRPAFSRPRYASTDEVSEWAKDLPERFLHCREMNHNWRPFNVGRHKDGGYERTLRCQRCKTRKVQHLDTHGMLVGSPRYEHPEGYQAQGLGRIVGEGRGALRIESILRIVGDSGVKA